LENGFFWKTAFFGKRLFLDPKNELFQKKPFPKKAVSKKRRSPALFCQLSIKNNKKKMIKIIAKKFKINFLKQRLYAQNEAKFCAKV